MAMHYTDIRGTLVSFLAEIGLVGPNVEATATDPVPPLSTEQELLVECRRSARSNLRSGGSTLTRIRCSRQISRSRR